MTHHKIRAPHPSAATPRTTPPPPRTTPAEQTRCDRADLRQSPQTTWRSGNRRCRSNSSATASNASANTGNWPYNSRPIPIHCEPCPGNTTTVLPTDAAAARHHTRTRLTAGHPGQPRHQRLHDRHPPPPLDAQTPTAAPTSTPHRPDPAADRLAHGPTTGPPARPTPPPIYPKPPTAAPTSPHSSSPRRRTRPRPLRLLCRSPRSGPAPRSRARWCR